MNGGKMALMGILLATAAMSPPSQGNSVEATTPVAPTPVLAEGTHHLLYKIHLRNIGNKPLRLLAIEAQGPAGELLTRWQGAELIGLVKVIGSKAVTDIVVEGGQRVVVFIDLTTASASSGPKVIRHRLTFAPTETENRSNETVLDTEPLRVRTVAPVTLGPPLKGGCWIASHGLSNASSHRRTLLAINGRARIAQRYAIDWIRVGADGQAFRGEPSVNANWTPHGAEVLAVAEGTVVGVLDGLAENDPTADCKAVPITLTTVGGNHVVIAIGRGRYAFYARLQPKSIGVKVGDHVRRGQIIARLGNSGQPDAPHIHMPRHGHRIGACGGRTSV